jgi:hypothetical protein
MWSSQPLDTIRPLDMLTAASVYQAQHDRIGVTDVPAPTPAQMCGLFLRATFGNRHLAACVARILACRPSMLLDVANALERGSL